MSDDAPTPATTPTQIRQLGPRTLGITWADGVESRLDVRMLRLACACARCVDEWTGREMLDPASVPEDVHPVRIEGVGRYAIQIAWSDGHDSGIYPFRRLRALADGTA
jgi:ATP-binding protein involved in chromosome partitioning